MPADEVARVEAAVAAAREAAKGDNVAAIKKATEELQQQSHRLAEQLYKQSQAGQPGGAHAPSQDDDVKDGEVFA